MHVCTQLHIHAFTIYRMDLGGTMAHIRSSTFLLLPLLVGLAAWAPTAAQAGQAIKGSNLRVASVYDTLSADPSYSSFKAFIDSSSLKATISAKGFKGTVLAPNNEVGTMHIGRVC
jgi:hypothetical protein